MKVVLWVVIAMIVTKDLYKLKVTIDCDKDMESNYNCIFKFKA